MYIFLIDSSKLNRNEKSQLVHNKIEKYYSLSPGSYNDNVSFSRNGKPYLSNNRFFSISHSQDLSIIAFSNQNIGIDIEKVQLIEDRLVDKFFSKKERRLIYHNFFNKNKAKTLVWTRKEAVCKFTGIGICKKSLNEDTYSLNNLYLESFFYSDYCISVCTEKKEKIIINNEKNE